MLILPRFVSHLVNVKLLILLIGILPGLPVSAQVIVNGYAKVTGIAGSVLTVSNVNETNDTFEDGEYIVIMQMQDNVIGANINDDALFGDLSSIANAGRYEIRQISTHTEVASVPTSFTISGSLTYAYNTGANSSVQVISLRRLGSPNYTTTSNITGLAWDGNVGGVVAIEVLGTLTLNHSISANGIGFRGGARSGNYYDGSTNCISTPYRTSSTNHAFKGEGIYKITNVNYTNARAKVLNGGGGGNHINGGGAGGGHFTTGGAGGTGWNSTTTGCPAASSVGGIGGLALNIHISASRIFMGGGGGGGQQNDGVGTAGGNGGGIVLLKASTLQTLAGCSVAPVISANGNAPSTTSGNDGSGGGGAAGTIVLQVNSYSIAGGGCALTISANGGNGGTVNNSTHAGGGAGAQGVVIFSGAQPTTNVTTTTANGNPGCSNNSVPCTVPAGSAAGATNNGIITGSTGPLPVELLGFQAKFNRNLEVELYWATASEINSDYFTVERSANGYEWSSILFRKAAGNSNQVIQYNDVDRHPLEAISYYRLQQTDYDGTYSTSHVVAIQNEGLLSSHEPAFNVYPNPFDGKIFGIDLSGYTGEILIELTDLSGRVVFTSTHVIDQNNVTLTFQPVLALSKGLYLVSVTERGFQKSKKLLVQ